MILELYNNNPLSTALSRYYDVIKKNHALTAVYLLIVSYVSFFYLLPFIISFSLLGGAICLSLIVFSGFNSMKNFLLLVKDTVHILLTSGIRVRFVHNLKRKSVFTMPRLRTNL